MEACYEKLGIPHIPSKSRKPLNGEDVYKYFKISSEDAGSICMVGDRLATDIALANFNGMYPIYTFPLDPSTQLWNVKPLVVIENLILKYKFGIVKKW